MELAAFLDSGIIERYCMGFSSAEEGKLVEQMCARYPQAQLELETVRGSFEKYLLANEVKPSAAVKVSLMQKIYRQQSVEDTRFPPLMGAGESNNNIQLWVKGTSIPALPSGFTENLFIAALPSTNQVTNFFVYAREGHDEEMHDGFIEHLYVIKGQCTMYFEGTPRQFKEGDLISIPPHVRHHAVVTSAFPMLALVQRQATA